MTYTYEYATQPVVARIRRRINDVFGPGEVIFSDEEILDVYNNLERSSIKRSSAYLLETIASNEAYVQKVIKLLSLSTNGPQVADSLRKDAALLRVQADEEDSQADGGAFDIAEEVYDVFSERERLRKDALRKQTTG